MDDAEKLARTASGPMGTELDPEAVARVFPQLVSTDEDGVEVIAYRFTVNRSGMESLITGV